jgi:hypothetical protein
MEEEGESTVDKTPRTPNTRALLSCQRDIDHPLMHVSGRPTRGCPTESDCSCRPFPKGLVALYRGIDVPVDIDDFLDEAWLSTDRHPGRTPLSFCRP